MESARKFSRNMYRVVTKFPPQALETLGHGRCTGISAYVHRKTISDDMKVIFKYTDLPKVAGLYHRVEYPLA